MKILVTGGRGFLGTALVRKLQERGDDIFLIESQKCDLSKPEAIPYLEKIEADFVFHLAGKTGVAFSWQKPEEYYRANLDTTRHVLEYCRIRKVPLHYVSTYIYGDQGPFPISETASPFPTNPYTHSKWMGEEMCRFYAQFFSVPLTISRPFNIYGPRQSPDFFIPRMIDQLRSQAEIKTLSLQSKRDYVFVEDVADALIALMQRGKSGECYNIGTGVCFSCEEVIKALQKIMGIQKPILLENRSRAEEILHAQADIDKLRSETGWRPKYTLYEGLTKCL